MSKWLCRVVVDPALTRRETDGFAFPLGTYPTEPAPIKPGYTVQFEAADGSDPVSDPGGFAGPNFVEELEEWPDRYVFDINISHSRVRALCRALFALLPARFYPILDVLGHDAFREIDPYIAYDLVGAEKFIDAIRAYEPFFFEDGLVGFGAMSVDPFFYVFLDEHKIVTVRVIPEMKDRIERLLAAFDLLPTEELACVDAAAHEHRGVIIAPDSTPEALTPDEVIERLRDAWGLLLNVDTGTNVDADGRELGITAWQCIARCSPEDEAAPDAYAEVLLSAGSLQQAEELAMEAVSDVTRQPPAKWAELDIIRSDRITPEQLADWLAARPAPDAGVVAVHDVRWLTGDPWAESGNAGRPQGGSPA